MKLLSLILSSSFLVSTMADGSCPIPADGTLCTFEEDPVICGGSCEYANPCVADASGYDVEADCVSKDACPTTSALTVCPAIYQPVLCNSTCEYSNDCEATSAGYAVKDCCPVVDPDFSCITVFEPVKCGEYDCEYSNSCFAEVAGFNVDSECTSVTTTECPVSDPDTFCATVSDPVICGECEYSNGCFAEAAGFVIASDCTSNLDCPTASADTFCITLFDPMVCGECEYPSACEAEAAGFNPSTDCTAKEACPTPNSETSCGLTYAPVNCGDCEYSNGCEAEAVGFVLATDCVNATQICFSGSSTVTVKDVGPIPLEDVAVGDEVLVDETRFERIYSFGHRDTKREATFLQLLPSGLELSASHMVFVEGQGPIPASMVKVGDRLSDGEPVERIQSVVRTGVYSPFTPSGAIVVNGVKASNYIAFQDTPVLKLGRFNTGLTFHWLDHAFQFPQRVWCHYLGFREETSDGGLSAWSEQSLAWGVWYLNQNIVIMAMLLIPFVTTLALFAAIENSGLVLLLAAIAVPLVILRGKQSKGIKS